LKYLLIIIYILSFSLLLESKQLKIAISKASGSESYKNYYKYIKEMDSTIEVIDFYKVSPEKAISLLSECSGLVLSGGPDAHPGRFGKAEDTSKCTIDLERDSLEFAIIEKAIEMKMPILGICRGEQLLNVALGGDLIVDLPSHFKELEPKSTGYEQGVKHQDLETKEDTRHLVYLMPQSLIHSICNVRSYEANSNHHQAVGRVSDLLIPSATTIDGTYEAIEWKDKTNKNWLLGVQWHPERLEKDNPLRVRIGREFVNQAKRYSEGK